MLSTKVHLTKKCIYLSVYAASLEKSSHLSQEAKDYIEQRKQDNPNEKYPEINIGML